MKHVREILPAVVDKRALKLAEAAAIIRMSPIGKDDLVFSARELIQCTLPHRDPGKVYEWTRTNGELTLGLVHGAGVGYPYGSIPRLVLFWLTREAVRTKSRRIELGKSFYGFLEELGFNPNRGGPRSDYRRVKEQIRRLFACQISFYIGDDSSVERRRNMTVSDDSELWWSPKRPKQSDLWESWVELGKNFFYAITASPVPLDNRALRKLKQSPLALDLYAWATHRVFSVRRKGQPQFVSWKNLHAQFGADYTDLKNFRKKAIAAFRKIAAVYPDLRLEFPAGRVAILPTSGLAIPAKFTDGPVQDGP